MNDYEKMNKKEINQHFIEACSRCDLPLIKYLLTSKELKPKADISTQNNDGLRLACLNGKASNQLEVVQYLLTSPELKKHADSTHEYSFTNACAFGKIEVIKFLLTSPELKEHPSIHIDKDYAFYSACKYERFDVLDFYINELKLEVTPAMIFDVEKNILIEKEGAFEHYSYHNAMKIRNILDLAQKMNESLPNKNTSRIKNKI